MDKNPEGSSKKTTKSAADYQATMETLPYEILLNILSRLPVTSLIPAKLVCRSWKNLVSDPSLVSMHFSHVSQKNPSLIMHFKYPFHTHLYFLPNSDRSENCTTLTRIALPDTPDFAMAGSCNGLICLYDHKSAVHVFNPFARSSLELPKPQKFPGQQFVSFGFGFIPSTKEYKVVRIVFYRKEEVRNHARRYYLRSSVQILTLGCSAWRSIGQSPYQLERKPSHAVVNGRLHWLTLLHMNIQQPRQIIASFDLEDERFLTVPGPNFLYFRRHPSHLAVLRGRLSLATYTSTGDLDVWIMEEYDVQESWVKSFTIGAHLPRELSQNESQSSSISESYRNNLDFGRVLCMMENGDILLGYEGRALLLYTPRTSTCKQIMFPGMPNFFDPIVHIGCLNWFANDCKWKM